MLRLALAVTEVCILLTLMLCIVRIIRVRARLPSVLGREHRTMFLWTVTRAGTEATRKVLVRLCLVLALIPLKMTLGPVLSICLHIGLNTWYGLYYLV